MTVETKVGSFKYYLTKTELKELRRRCKKAKLSFHAMASRPSAAKELLADNRLSEN
jgi:hypothetical protein